MVSSYYIGFMHAYSSKRDTLVLRCVWDKQTEIKRKLRIRKTIEYSLWPEILMAHIVLQYLFITFFLFRQIPMVAEVFVQLPNCVYYLYRVHASILFEYLYCDLILFPLAVISFRESRVRRRASGISHPLTNKLLFLKKFL